MRVDYMSSYRIGCTPDCQVCRAGAALMFNWGLADKAGYDREAFARAETLRWGWLFDCKACRQPWYLDDRETFMNYVPRARLPLIHEWNREAIQLGPDHLAKLEAIGRTPPDLYGNGSQFHGTPCGIVTKSGDRTDLAVVSRQRQAPFEESKQYRLASEIAEIYASPYALPLAVRIATSKAMERAMGFCPTVVKIGFVKHLVLKGCPNFLVRKGCRASAVKLSDKKLDLNHLPEIYQGADGITYFVADP